MKPSDDALLDVVDGCREVSRLHREATPEADGSETLAEGVREALEDLETVCEVARQYKNEEEVIQGILTRNLPPELHAGH